jgi:translation initiation factor 2 subunit 3
MVHSNMTGKCRRFLKDTLVEDIDVAAPGSVVGVGTLITPELCRGDRLVGQLLGLRDTHPPVFNAITMRFKLLSRVEGQEEHTKMDKVRSSEVLMLKVGSAWVTRSR